MQRSRMALNVVIDSDGRYLSEKFKRIKKDIEDSHGQVQIVFSNFIEKGILAFADYCGHLPGEYVWRRFDEARVQKLSPNEIVYAEIHGDVDY